MNFKTYLLQIVELLRIVLEFPIYFCLICIVLSNVLVQRRF